MVPNGSTEVSAATVPGRAWVPLAVMPTSFGFPLLGPSLMTGEPKMPKPHHGRSQLQHFSQLQYPVISMVITTGWRPAGGRIVFVTHPDIHTSRGNETPASTAGIHFNPVKHFEKLIGIARVIYTTNAHCKGSGF